MPEKTMTETMKADATDDLARALAAEPGLLADLRTLLDKQAIAELIYRMARAIDRQDAELMASLFHPDATDDHGMFTGPASEFVTWVMGVLAAMEGTQHVNANMLIAIDGDRASAETYWVAHHRIRAANGGIFLTAAADAPDQFMVGGGRYLDSFERRGGTWRFTHRHAVFDWQGEAASTETWDRPALDGWAFGQPSRADASYAMRPPLPGPVAPA